MSVDPQYGSGQRPPEASGWAVGGTVFAACILMLVGVFQSIAGLVAIFDDNFYVVTRNYTFDLDTTVYGWIHLLIGVLLVIVAFWSVQPQPLGRCDGGHPGRPQRGGQLLLHPLLPVLGDPRDRARRLGDLVADAARGDGDLRAAWQFWRGARI